MHVMFEGDDLARVMMQMQRFLADASLGLVPVPGGLMPGAATMSALGRPAPGSDEPMSHWEQAKQLGYRQGYERAQREAQLERQMAKAAVGSDYAHPAEQPDVANQVNPTWPPADVMSQPVPVPGTAAEKWSQQAEANRKTAVAIGAEREKHYADPNPPLVPRSSVSSPEEVAKTLRQQHHPLPGE